MANTLKPISEGMRKFLAQIGETPEQHQREKLGQRARLPRKDRYTPPAVQPASTIVAKWKSPEPTWLADARVLFTRMRICKSCGSSVHEMHYLETFIRMRSKDDPRTVKYIPARSALFAHLELPKLVVHQNMFCFYCPLCWTPERPLENPVCLAELVTLAPAATASNGESSALPNGSPGSSSSTSPRSPSANSSPPQPAATSEPSPELPSDTEDQSTTSSDPHGSDFSSLNHSSPVSAQPTHTLTA